MNINIDLITNAIKAVAPPAVSLAINQAQSNEYVIKALKKLGLAKIQPGGKFLEIYATALVEYDPKSQLKFLRDRENQETFWKAFVSFNDQEWNTLKAKAEKAQIDFTRIEEFREVFISVANRSSNPQQAIAIAQIQQQLQLLTELLAKEQSTEPLEQLPYPDEFKALIEDKTKGFCGRGFVFKAFDDFRKQYPKGYFTVIGDAGMGKSAIAATSVLKYKAICYFNILSEGRNTPEKFLKSIRQQFKNRYSLHELENADLPTLLTKVSAKLVKGETLVIVVDALDEVEETSTAGNILDLPKHLPEGIYFLLTRRAYAENKKRLLTDGVPQQELDLTAKQYEEFHRADIKEFISVSISDDPEYKDELQKWIRSRNYSAKEFIEQLVLKSENNFMYLRYVIPDIAEGIYQDSNIDKLPQGLKDYYQWHWQRMGMNEKPQELMVIILFILVRVTTSPTLKMIAEISEREEYEVETVLHVQWVEYVRKQQIEGQVCYSIYHTSFLDFLKAQRELQHTRKLFQKVDQRISEYLYS